MGNRKFVIENSVVPMEEIIEYLCEGNCKEDLAKLYIDKIPLDELQALICEVRDAKEEEEA